MAELTHFTKDGRPQMVNVGQKAVSDRIAIAAGQVLMAANTLERIKQGGIKKGDVLPVAQLAGIMGAKQTSLLIPLCHPLSLDHIDLNLSVNEADCAIDICAKCQINGRTGVEMEALTAVAVAALTIYDMCKAIDKEMRIQNIRLLHKSGGKSGTFNAP